MAAAAAAVASNLKRCIPLFDRLLIKKADTVTKSKGGIFIPEKAQAKVLKGTVLATGPGIRNQDGKLLPLSVNIGDVVMLAEYGGTKIELSDNQEYHLYREDDVLAVIDETREKFFPLYDRVIVKKADPVKQSKGGIVIPEKAQSKVLKGTVVYAGPGQRNQSGSIVPLSVKVGDVVLLPEYGGQRFSLTEDEELFMYRESDILATVDDD